MKKILSLLVSIIIVGAGCANTSNKLASKSPLNSVSLTPAKSFRNVATLASAQTNSTLSIRLKIPIINIDAPIESVGLAADGSMEVPGNPAHVGWFNKGTLPGAIGSAVIAGHYGIWKNGEVSAFQNLEKLSVGNIISIEDENGIATNFKVKEIKKYDPSSDASEIFISSDGKSHLNLITCNGIWNEATQSYSQRLVIFTDKE